MNLVEVLRWQMRIPGPSLRSLSLAAARVGTRTAVGLNFQLSLRLNSRTNCFGLLRSGRLATSIGIDLLLLSLDLNLFVFDVEAQAVVNAHVLVRDPHQGKKSNEVSPPVLDKASCSARLPVLQLQRNG